MQKTILWDGKTSGEWKLNLEGADMLTNLCSKNVNCRYTIKNRTEIINSRVIPTQLLGKTIKKLEVPPKLWINITSATIYRHAEDRPQNGEIGYGFSIDVCKKWEDAFFQTNTPLTRKVALRMGIVLGNAAPFGTVHFSACFKNQEELSTSEKAVADNRPKAKRQVSAEI